MCLCTYIPLSLLYIRVHVLANQTRTHGRTRGRRFLHTHERASERERERSLWGRGRDLDAFSGVPSSERSLPATPPRTHTRARAQSEYSSRRARERESVTSRTVKRPFRARASSEREPRVCLMICSHAVMPQLLRSRCFNPPLSLSPPRSPFLYLPFALPLAAPRPVSFALCIHTDTGCIACLRPQTDAGCSTRVEMHLRARRAAAERARAVVCGETHIGGEVYVHIELDAALAELASGEE